MENNVIGAKTCHVCKRSFPLIFERHYTARGVTTSGLIATFGNSEPQLHDAFDCPHCGCQNIVGDRLREYNPDAQQNDHEEEDNT